MDCPRCKSSKHVKDGIVQNRQRYRCKDCGFRYTVAKKSDVKTVEERRLALEMYLEGLGFRSIGRILRISHVTVYNWIKKWGEEVELPVRDEPVEIVELDEMHSYVGEKKTTVGYGLLLIDLEKGTSILSVATGRPKQGGGSGKN